MARDSRTETIHALDTFIATQHLLLARQKDDIERLQRLRRDLHERPSGVLSNLSDELDHGTFRLSAQTDLRLVLPQRIDWSVFDKADTTAFATLVSRVNQKRAGVSKTQQSPLSELQVLVKTAKKEILVPILERISKSTIALHLDSEDEEEDLDPLERRRLEERTKILELKKRKVRGGESGLSLPTTRNVVFVRDDVEDETGAVDIDSWEDGERERNREKTKNRTGTSTQALMEEPAKIPKPSLRKNGRPHKTKCKSPEEDEERPRKKTKLLSAANSRPHTRVTNRSSVIQSAKSSTPSDSDDLAAVDGHAVGSPSQEDNQAQKPKSETYKQAWSVDEQNLLEQLLEAIPDGEKYRWLKISRAMGGRRTPRQVASRVQKYFEKLRKFGVSVD